MQKMLLPCDCIVHYITDLLLTYIKNTVITIIPLFFVSTRNYSLIYKIQVLFVFTMGLFFHIHVNYMQVKLQQSASIMQNKQSF